MPPEFRASLRAFSRAFTCHGHGKGVLLLVATLCVVAALVLLITQHGSNEGPIPSATIEFPERGRVELDLERVPREGLIELVLALTESDAEPGPRLVRIVCVDGRLLETTGHSSHEEPSALRAKIDARFLTRGSYLLEVDTKERHPLHLRRYVLEIR